MQQIKQFVMILVVALPHLLPAQSQENVGLVGQLPYPDLLKDVWGYVDASGTEYALVGTQTGTSIVSLANPSQPEELFLVPGPESGWRDIKTYGHYAYVSNETGDGVQIIDLLDLPNGYRKKDTVLAGAATIHNLWVDEGTLYLVGLDSEVFNGGMIICDLTADPWRPRILGVYDRAYVHDVYVRDGLAYTAEINDRRLAVIDVSKPAAPELLGERTYPNALTHNTWLNDAGDVVFTTDETRDVYLRAWDISNPTNILALDSIRSRTGGGIAIPHNVHVLDDYLVTSYYTDGVHLTDASRPDILIEVGHYDTSPLASATANGCWGAYPFLPSGLILASDIQEGLFVLQPTYQRAAYLEGLVVDSVSGALLENAFIEVLTTPATVHSQEDGSFKLGIAEAGPKRVAVYRYGYVPDTLEVDFVRTQTRVLTLALQPAPRLDVQVNVIDATSGQPIEDARLLAMPFTSALELAYASDAVGQVELDQAFAGLYELAVGKWGYQQAYLPLNLQAESAAITVALQRGLEDDFTLDLGWTEEGTATIGRWERARPRLTTRFNIPINPPADWEGDPGDKAYVTGAVGDTYFDNDVDNGATILTSPVFDLSGYEDPVVRFRWWLVNYIDNSNGLAGNGFLQVSIRNRRETVLVTVFANSFNEDRWRLWEFRVRDYLQPDDQMQLEFIAADPEPGNLLEAGVDHIQVYELGATNLPNAPEQAVRVFPNPLRGPLNLVFPQPLSEAVQVEVLDLHGRLRARKQLAAGQLHAQWSLPGLPTGLYLLRGLAAGQQLFHQKLMIP